MNTKEIKKIIIDQKEEIDEIFQKEKIIPRNLPKEELTNFLKHPNILTITGVRRSGKSVLSTQLLKGKKHGHINFDDERIINIEPKDLNNVLQAFYELYGPDVEYFTYLKQAPNYFKESFIFISKCENLKILLKPLKINHGGSISNNDLFKNMF